MLDFRRELRGACPLTDEQETDAAALRNVVFRSQSDPKRSGQSSGGLEVEDDAMQRCGHRSIDRSAACAHVRDGPQQPNKRTLTEASGGDSRSDQHLCDLHYGQRLVVTMLTRGANNGLIRCNRKSPSPRRHCADRGCCSAGQSRNSCTGLLRYSSTKLAAANKAA